MLRPANYDTDSQLKLATKRDPWERHPNTNIDDPTHMITTYTNIDGPTHMISIHSAPPKTPTATESITSIYPLVQPPQFSNQLTNGHELPNLSIWLHSPFKGDAAYYSI